MKLPKKLFVIFLSVFIVINLSTIFAFADILNSKQKTQNPIESESKLALNKILTEKIDMDSLDASIRICSASLKNIKNQITNNQEHIADLNNELLKLNQSISIDKSKMYPGEFGLVDQLITRKQSDYPPCLIFIMESTNIKDFLLRVETMCDVTSNEPFLIKQTQTINNLTQQLGSLHNQFEKLTIDQKDLITSYNSRQIVEQKQEVILTHLDQQIIKNLVAYQAQYVQYPTQEIQFEAQLGPILKDVVYLAPVEQKLPTGNTNLRRIKR